MKKSVLLLIGIISIATTAFIAAKVVSKGDATTAIEGGTQAANLEIPRLLERQANLGNAEERANVSGIFDKSNAALQKNPNDYAALLQLAELYMNEARVTGEHPYYYPAAIQVLDRVLMGAQSNTEFLYRAMYMKSSVQLSLHQFQKALVTGQEAVKLNPYDAGIYGVLVDAHVELGQYAKAVEMSDKMVSIRPDLRSYSRISYLRELHGDVPGAIDALKMAVDAGYPGYEQSAWCRTTLGNLYERYGDLDNAAMHYQIALDERAEFPFAIAGLASVEAKRGNNENAMQLLEKAAKIIPEVSFHVQKAELLASQGDEAGARKLAAEALEMMQEDTDKGHNMDLEYARVHLDLMGDPSKALEYATKEYNARPNNIDVNKVLAACELELGHLDEASRYIQTARATKTLDPETLVIEGMIRNAQGKGKEAKALIQEAFKHNPYLKGGIYTQALALI